MSYSIDYLADKGIVEIKIDGRLNFKTAEQYSKEAVNLGRHNNCTKFLFDHSNTTKQIGITKIHATGEELQQFGFKDSDRVAIIISNSSNESELPEAENQNSRLSLSKYFYEDNITEAFNWLAETES